MQLYFSSETPSLGHKATGNGKKPPHKQPGMSDPSKTWEAPAGMRSRRRSNTSPSCYQRGDNAPFKSPRSPSRASTPSNRLCENGKPKSQSDLGPAQCPGQGDCQRPPWIWLAVPPRGRGSPTPPLPEGKPMAEHGQQRVRNVLSLCLCHLREGHGSQSRSLRVQGNEIHFLETRKLLVALYQEAWLTSKAMKVPKPGAGGR